MSAEPFRHSRTNDRPTVLFVSHDASRTGAPIFLYRLLRWLRDNTNIPFAILFGQPGELLSDFQSLAPVYCYTPELTLVHRVARRLGASSPSPGHLASLRHTLRESGIGLIYANTVATGYLLEFLSFLNCPSICHIHELQEVIRIAAAGTLGLLKKHASSYIAVSRAVKANLVQNHDIEAHKIRVIHGFVPTQMELTDAGTESRARVFAELGIPTGSRLVCCCGSIEARKGADLFLQVAAALRAQYHQEPVHFVWVGGSARQARDMQQQAKTCQGMVHFIGARKHTVPYYQACDLFLLPSREDPFPLVMLEAALQEKPIVCFDSGGAPEFVEADAGFVVPHFDIAQMVNGVVCLLSSPVLQQRMGLAAKAKVLERHALEKCGPLIASQIERAQRRAGRT